MSNKPAHTRISAANESPEISPARYMGIIAVCLLAMAVAYVLDSAHFVVPARYFLPFHLIVEYSSIVVSFAVFITGWFGYKQTRNTRDLLIGATFLAAGILDFIHVLSYKGMPDFLSVNTVGIAAAYWVAARLVVGMGLLVVSFVHPTSDSKLLSPAVIISIVIIGLAGLVSLLMYYGSAAGELFFNSNGLTGLKIWLEFFAVMLYAFAFFAISTRRGWEPGGVVNLRSALIVAIFAELAFTLYASPYGPFNALGHIFKTAAYYLILLALFTSAIQRPYRELSKARDEMELLYQDAQEHRREMERSFTRIGTALSSSLNREEALDLIAELAVDMEHVDCSIVALLDTNGKTVNVAAQKGGCHDAHRPVEISLQIGRQAIDERRTIVNNHLEDAGLIMCDFSKPDCLRSVACSPMVNGDEVLGLIAVFSHTEGVFEEGDVRLLEGFASHAAVAMHNALSYERESRIANVLQNAFLDSQRVVTDRFEVAQVYRPALNEALVGGDFYDVIQVSEHRIALVIGDVSGKGLAAAVHTAMVKFSLRAYIYEGHMPGEAMRLLSGSVDALTDVETFITLFFGILDTRTGELVYANAGHEAPVYSTNGHYTILPSTGPALGLGIDKGYGEGKITLAPGSILLLYTDGISEAREGKVFLGTDGIGKELLTCDELDSEDVARCVYEAAVVFAGGELKDDAAILAVRMRPD